MAIQTGTFRDQGGIHFNVMAYGAAGDGITNDRAAFVSTDGLGGSEASPGTYAIATSDLTLTSGLFLPYGAKIKPASGIKVNIDGPLTAGAYQIFDLSAGGEVIVRGSDHVKPEWYGAIADADTLAAHAANVIAFNASVQLRPIELSGNYYINDTLNFTGLNFTGLEGGSGIISKRRLASKITWRGASTRAMLETRGSLFIDLENVQFEAPSTHPAACGILHGRIGEGSSDNHNHRNVHVGGYFTVAAVVEVCSETNTWDSCLLENWSPDADSRVYIRCGTLPPGITPRFGAYASGQPNTTGTWHGGSVRHHGAGSAVSLRDVNDFSMFGTYLFALDNAIVEFMGECRSIGFYDCRHETLMEGGVTGGEKIVHFASAGSYRDIHYIGGAVAGRQPQYIMYGENGAKLYNLFVRGVNMDQAFHGLNVDEMHDSDVDLRGANLTVRTSCTDTALKNPATLTLPVGSTVEVPRAHGSAVWNPPSLANGSQQVTTIPVTGAVIGDFVEVSFSNDLQHTTLLAYVHIAGSVAIVHRNGTGGTVNLPSGTLRVTVRKAF